MAPDGATCSSVVAATPHPSSLARGSLRRQTPEVGAVCPNWARTDLCGGCPVTGIPTAITAGVVPWSEVVSTARVPAAMTAGPGDLCVLPYTSGTTGKPKGCVHTHRSVMRTAVGSGHWFKYTQDSVMLAVLPFFHVTGMASAMNGPLFTGSSIVVLTRWDRDVALACMERYRVTDWQAITTMVIDILANPNLGKADLSSLAGVRGGGAAMPAALYAKLKTLTGLDYIEGYGLSETMAATHTIDAPAQAAVPGHSDPGCRLKDHRPNDAARGATLRDGRDRDSWGIGDAGVLAPARGHRPVLH